MKTCAICGKELDSGAVVHRTCLAASKADYDKINNFEQSQCFKLLEENARLRAENAELRARLEV